MSTDGTKPEPRLSASARTLLGRLREQQKAAGEGQMAVNPSLAFLAEHCSATMLSVAPDLKPEDVGAKAAAAIAKESQGVRFSEEELTQRAFAHALERGKHKTYEQDLVAAVLALAGLTGDAPGGAETGDEAGEGDEGKPKSAEGDEPEKKKKGPIELPPASTIPWPPREGWTGGPVKSATRTSSSGSGGATEPASDGGDTGEPVARPDTPNWSPADGQSTSTLERLGRDLTNEAAEGLLPDVLGREDEIQLVIETLVRRTKPNPLLVGPAGVGKTAIVEGLARRVVAGDVPERLRNTRIFALQVTDLMQGMKYQGALEERLNHLIREAEQPGIIVFLDELHAVVGAGGGSNDPNDVANMLKPALARGKMSCIGATTDGEYNQFIVSDSAFERRFQPLRIQELPREATLQILSRRVEKAQRDFGVGVPDDAVQLALSLADRFMRNRYRPDKAIDVFDQAVARAQIDGVEQVTSDMVRDVVTRMVGVPVDDRELSEKLDALPAVLEERAGCSADDADRIAHRLRVTMRGMDVRPLRPNGVFLTVSPHASDVLARVLSDALFGIDSPVVDVDLSGYGHPEDVNRFTGPPPGYVGFDTPNPLHLALAQRPWSVVLLRRPDHAHPAVQLALANALNDGFFKDQRGRRYYVCDTICVLTVAGGADFGEHRRVGFATGVARDEGSPSNGTIDVLEYLTPDLGACVDMACYLSGAVRAVDDAWVREGLLEPVAATWQRDHGVGVEWDDSLVAWLVHEARERDLGRGGTERLFEDEAAPTIVETLVLGDKGVTWRVRRDAESFVVETTVAATE